MYIIKNNADTLVFPIVDVNNAAITNLASLISATFSLKINESDSDSSASMLLTLGDGDITANSPTTGSLSIALTPSNTSSLTETSYYCNLVLYYSSSNIKTVVLTENKRKIKKCFIES